jgi:hypothetical protein
MVLEPPCQVCGIGIFGGLLLEAECGSGNDAKLVPEDQKFLYVRRQSKGKGVEKKEGDRGSQHSRLAGPKKAERDTKFG